MKYSLIVLAATMYLSGCDQPEQEPEEQPVSQEPIEINELPPPALGDGHNHPDHGPHDGDLIELGGEDYHAELVHDHEQGTVTIYLLDSSAKKLMPIDATVVTINLTHDGNPEQFKLKASPEESDPDGNSSRFVSSDPHLAKDLDNEKTQGRLVVKIKGQQFTGKIEHHDHAGHNH